MTDIEKAKKFADKNIELDIAIREREMAEKYLKQIINEKRSPDFVDFAATKLKLKVENENRLKRERDNLK